MAFEAGSHRTHDSMSKLRFMGLHGLLPEIPVGKWVFDKVFAAVALVLLAPAMAVIAILLRLNDSGPVLYAHRRIGKDGRMFRCYKFRTMYRDGDRRLAWVFDIDPLARAEWEENRKLEHDPRVHPLGRILRCTSLDELPQFWNVLIGDMSIVGPRPIVSDEVRKYGRHFAAYCAVRPGITGAWQVSGRNETGYDERVALDAEYVRTATLRDDIRIVLRTVGVVLSRRGAM